MMTEFEKQYHEAVRRLILSDFPTLNPMQQEAVLATEGALLILAGAGSIPVNAPAKGKGMNHYKNLKSFRFQKDQLKILYVFVIMLVDNCALFREII